MYLNQLVYNSFSTDLYEKFLIETFNTNLKTKEDLTYLKTDSTYNINKITYYGSYTDNSFNEIELYTICLNNINEYKNIQDVIFDLLSLNQNNFALTSVYSETSRKWFSIYTYTEYIIEDNKLILKQSKLNENIHWYGFRDYDDFLLKTINTKQLSAESLKNLSLRKTDSPLLNDICDIYEKYGEKSYNMILEVITDILFNKKSNSNTKKDIHGKLKKYKKSSKDKLTKSTVFDLFDVLNNQEMLSEKQVRNVCEDTLIEYLCMNTKLLKKDIEIYVKYSFTFRNEIKAYIRDSINNNGRSNVNLKIPLSIFFNMDSISKCLEDIKILDFSLSNGRSLTTMTLLLSQLIYVNRIIEGYRKISFHTIFANCVKNNIYGISLNKQSIINTKVALQLQYNQNNTLEFNIRYADALNLYKEYPLIVEGLKDVDMNLSKTEVINKILYNYNRKHLNSKMNINFEKQYYEKRGMEILVWPLDYSEVFKNNSKFNIIISDIEQKTITNYKDEKQYLKRFKVFDRELNYQYYFIEKAIEIIDDNGIISLMVDDDYKNMENNKIRKILLKHNIRKIGEKELIFNKVRKKDNKINDKFLQKELTADKWNLEEN